ncbi:hypothetical protein ABD07_04565 [Nitrosomonas oligotropha]|nr:hypothetical protein [Nitrosomonas oligotropha]
MFGSARNFIQFTVIMLSKSIPASRFRNSPHQPGCSPAFSRKAGTVLKPGAYTSYLFTSRTGFLENEWGCLFINGGRKPLAIRDIQFHPSYFAFIGWNTALRRKIFGRMTGSLDVTVFCPPPTTN